MTAVPSVADEKVKVDFWFDPACPWAWITSRWILEVEQVRPIRVDFHVMSLAILNEEKKLSEPVRRLQLGPVRVLTAVAQAEGEHLLRDLYTAIGTRIHVGGTQASPELVSAALSDVGVSTSYVDLWDSQEYDEALAKSHHQAMELVGYDVGTPVIRVEGEAYFGPVVTPAPRGEAAGRLWDGFLLVAHTPGFFEIKRSRTSNPSFE